VVVYEMGFTDKIKNKVMKGKNMSMFKMMILPIVRNFVLDIGLQAYADGNKDTLEDKYNVKAYKKELHFQIAEHIDKQIDDAVENM
jgi:hypothetical protein